MRYFAIFSDSGERILSLVADGMPLYVSDILKAYPKAIEISEADQKLYMNGYIRGNNGRPVKEIINIDIQTLKNEKITSFQYLCKSELSKTDYLIIEQIETSNLTDAEYTLLKTKRKSIRDYELSLETEVNNATTVDSINSITFNFIDK